MHVQGVEVAIRLLQMTAAAGHFLQENSLYKSFRLLQRVKEALPGPKEEEDHHSRYCCKLCACDYSHSYNHLTSASSCLGRPQVWAIRAYPISESA